ncbi:D-ribose ABC transporter substrate-binding protein [Youhaiella tibetensis]|uniref:Sugar ABC transporter substrate-binding protein n=1 Tax=Paradevosia tibetensis TaxID=1447062 RepID=A0A5B9DTS7_9HYPH|nr:sugar ABC transporter substrate-binding protein [Youhaiella tibetensis]AKR57392.1 Ribose ABC transport system, periplasmic ribose-binding protein RbsB [Devosia sp. H5989]QEE22325.1 sugar ABC transporter substrate-binding protein [Youhaiella tibetensis]GGF43252.1 D-ribose ABC transporter substrate-binding protein [Youhaiella tibetensis]
MKKLLLAGVALAAMTAVSYAADTYVVGMKGPGAGNPFWAAVEKGAKDKGAELGVDVVVVAPPAESDVQAQITQIEDLIAQKVSGIALAPTDPNALAPVVDAAKAAGIPVVFVDTKGVNEGVTFIGTDNAVGAALAADFMCKNLPQGSEVAILQGLISQSTGQARAEGSKKGLEACGLKVVAEQTAEWDRAKGQSVMENILTGNPNIKGVFASNDNMALGAVEALKAAAKLQDVMVVGFDANPDAAASILAGEMTASVAQAPANIGGFGVQALVDLKAGKTIEPVIDTGTVLVTKENADKYK